MKKSYKFIIRGNPLAKKRPKFARVGDGVRCYNDQMTEEGRFLTEVMTQFKESPLQGALAMGFEFVIVRPKNHFGTGRNWGKLKKSAPVHKISTPDLDNYIKFAKDSMNGYVYHDDSQVVKYIGDPEKRYCDVGEFPHTVIVVQILE